MRLTNGGLDREMALRLMTHGVFLGRKTPTMDRKQALMLLADAMLDKFVNEFKSLLNEILPTFRLKEMKATPEEMRIWFGEDPWHLFPEETAGRKDERPPEDGGTPSCSKGIVRRWMRK